MKIEYIDKRPIAIPYLKKYPNGCFLPDKNSNAIEVTETEKVWLLRMRNGKNPCFIEKTTTRKTIENEEDNGSR